MSRTVMITGAAGGLGRAIAEEFRARGDHLVLTDRSRELSALHASSVAELINADLCDDEDLQRLCARLESGEPAIDLLINNAGIGVP